MVEDLHWADRSTCDFLSFLARNVRHERLAVIVSYRGESLHRQHALRPFVRELERYPRMRRLELAPFTREELVEQATGILEVVPDARLVERLLERSEGNPFFVEELLAASESGDALLPESLRDALLIRVESLSDATRSLLTVMAVAGYAVEEPLLAAVGELPPGGLRAALREAVGRHVLRHEPPAFGYSFRRALLREAVYADLLPGGQVLMLVGQGAEALSWTNAAVDAARMVGAAHVEAAALNTLGPLRCLLGDPEAGLEAIGLARAIAKQLGLVEELGRSYMNEGDTLDQAGRSDEAIAVAREGLEALRAVGGERRWGDFPRGEIAGRLCRAGRWDEAEAVLKELEAGRPTGLIGGITYQNLAQLQADRGELEAAAHSLEQARPLVERSGGAMFAAPTTAPTRRPSSGPASRQPRRQACWVVSMPSRTMTTRSTPPGCTSWASGRRPTSRWTTPPMHRCWPGSERPGGP